MELTSIEEMKNAYDTIILVAKPKGKQALVRTWNRRNCRRLKNRILSVCVSVCVFSWLRIEGNGVHFLSMTFGFYKDGEFLDRLTECQLLKKHFASCS